MLAEQTTPFPKFWRCEQCGYWDCRILETYARGIVGRVCAKCFHVTKTMKLYTITVTIEAEDSRAAVSLAERCANYKPIDKTLGEHQVVAVDWAVDNVRHVRKVTGAK